MLVGSFVVGYLLSTQLLFPRPETAGAGISTPSLYGESREAAERAIRKAGLQVGDVSELASLDTEPGQVLAQDPIPGQQLRRGGVVSLAVSGGRPELMVPPVRGMPVETARELLEGLGFEVAVQRGGGDGSREGLVLSTQPTTGTARALPAVVTLQVSAGAEEATPPARPGVGDPGAQEGPERQRTDGPGGAPR